MAGTDRVEVVIVGAGPAGLAAAGSLIRRGVPCVVIEAGDRVGASWHRHYDRLCLHTTRAHSALPGLAFDADVPRYPTRAQVIAYLEKYAAHFHIEPSYREALERARPVLTGPGEGWEVQTNRRLLVARHLVIATGLNREPVRPVWPGQEYFTGSILHSADYRTADALHGQRVLVVGMGNTGAEIALDLHEHGAHAMVSVRRAPNILPREFLGTPVQVTSLRTARLPVRVRDALGRLASRVAFGDLAPFGLPPPAYGPATQVLKYGRTPVIDIGTVALIRVGAIQVVPGVESFTAGGVTLAGGRTVDVDAVVLATGYRPALDAWIEPRVLAEPRSNLHLIGYRNAVTGLLRQIADEAERIGRVIPARLAPGRRIA
jgi:indole-3-pyruvate monooxygenase